MTRGSSSSSLLCLVRLGWPLQSLLPFCFFNCKSMVGRLSSLSLLSWFWRGEGENYRTCHPFFWVFFPKVAMGSLSSFSSSSCLFCKAKGEIYAGCLFFVFFFCCERHKLEIFVVIVFLVCKGKDKFCKAHLEVFVVIVVLVWKSFIWLWTQ